jgi:hypothetical protein
MFVISIVENHCRSTCINKSAGIINKVGLIDKSVGLSTVVNGLHLISKPKNINKLCWPTADKYLSEIEG